MVKWAPVCAKFAHTPLIGRKGLSRTIYKAMCKFLGDSNVQILHIANFWGIASEFCKLLGNSDRAIYRAIMARFRKP